MRETRGLAGLATLGTLVLLLASAAPALAAEGTAQLVVQGPLGLEGPVSPVSYTHLTLPTKA